MKTEELFKSIVDTCNEGLAIFNESGEVEYINDSFKSKVTLNHLNECVQLFSSIELDEIFNGKYKKKGFLKEKRVHSRDSDEIYWIHFRPLLLHDTLYYILELFDVKNMMNNSSFLKENVDRLDAIIETAVDGIIIINDKGIIIRMNQASLMLFGYKEYELIEKNVKMLMPDPHHSNHDNYINNYLNTGKKKIIGIGREVLGLRKDGSTFPFKLSISEVRMNQKKIFTGIIHDLTDKALAKEIQGALTKEIELNELKSKFVSLASHEFRTPLSTIASSAQLIAKYNLEHQEPNRRKHIDRIQKNVKHLTTVLGDFLSLSKLEEGMVKVFPSKINLKSFFQDLLEEMNLQRKEGQNIIIDYNGNDTVEIDEKLLTHILHNLINNAIKYSSKNTAVSLLIKNQTNQLTIEVKDDGIGIPENELNNLFERFYRASNVSNIQGTGLGLNLVKKYVELMNGTITVESELNKGTKFTIFFKLPI